MKRYNWNGDESRSGPVVLHSDHDAESLRIMRKVYLLRKENEFLWQMVRDANQNQDFDFDAAMGDLE